MVPTTASLMEGVASDLGECLKGWTVGFLLASQGLYAPTQTRNLCTKGEQTILHPRKDKRKLCKGC